MQLLFSFYVPFAWLHDGSQKTQVPVRISTVNQAHTANEHCIDGWSKTEMCFMHAVIKKYAKGKTTYALNIRCERGS